MQYTDIFALIGTIGGVQGVVEAARWWQSRRLRRREDEAAVSAVESENNRKQTDWLESRLAERDAKIDGLYAELRKEQSLRIGEIYQRHQVELRLAEAEARKCCVSGCQQRQPPSDY